MPQLYDYECRNYVYECAAEATSVQPKFSNVLFLPANMGIPNVQIPPNFSPPVFEYHVFPGFLGTPEFFAFIFFPGRARGSYHNHQNNIKVNIKTEHVKNSGVPGYPGKS